MSSIFNSWVWRVGKSLWWPVLLASVVSCGGGSGTPLPETVAISGSITSVDSGGATVCLDENRDGRCGPNERWTLASVSGTWALEVPKDSEAPLLALIAGESRSGSDILGITSYRMASPSYSYGTVISPFTTLVHLSHESDKSIAEDIVRGVLGLPPRFDLAVDLSASPTSLGRKVGYGVIEALKISEATIDWTAADALERLAEMFPYSLSALPTLAITTKDGSPILSKEIYVDATYVLVNPVTNSTTKLAGKIRGRGNATWGQPKNPYKVQFTNDAAYAEVSDLLGMKKSRNWALLADYFDRSLMRNHLALAVGNSAVFRDGLKWSPSAMYVEVTLNGDYVGVYLLSEDVRVDPSRLNLKKMAKDDVDGGYIVEADGRQDCFGVDPFNLRYTSPLLGTKFCVDTPDEGSITANQLAYVKELLRAAESEVVAGPGFSLLNLASFADWYLVNELFKSLDAPFFTSVFMWKDTSATAGPDRLLNMGPIWDFDVAAGNMNYDQVWLSGGCWVGRQHPEINGNGNWFAEMLKREVFRDLVFARWHANRPRLERFVNASIDAYARRLRTAQQRNFARWDILGIQLTNYYTWQSWNDEVAFLRRFLIDRMDWMDMAFSSPAAFASSCR